MNTILLIDDDETILSSFSLALRSYGYRVFEATTGISGLELARQQLPDLIISDVLMPGGDGDTLLAKIRQNPDLCHKQVVLMTGQVDEVTPRRRMEAGADDFLVKPVSLHDLLKCVEARLNRAQVNWRVEDRMLAELRSTLHSNLPHELFTPLGDILGLTEILRRDLGAMPIPEARDILADVHHSGMRLHRTLRNYLTLLELSDAYEKSGTGKLPDLLSVRDVEEAIWSGVRAAARLHKRTDDVDVEIEPCPILASPADLSLMAEELVHNACNYSRQGTPIDIVFTGDGVLTVSDSGRGMSEEEMQQLGSLQAWDRSQPGAHDLGLGLVVLHKLAAKCGTKPVFESRPFAGTQVRITFLKRIHVPAQPKPAQK